MTEADARALADFAAWFEREYPRLVEKAARRVPLSPAPDADGVVRRLVARAVAEHEVVFVPARFHHDSALRKNEILALLVLGVARARGREFKDAAEAREAVTRLVAQTMDEGKVKAALGGAGALVAPLLSPDLARRAWRLFVRMPAWGKVAVAGGVAAALLVVPMVTPLSLGVLASEEFRAPPTA